MRKVKVTKSEIVNVSKEKMIELYEGTKLRDIRAEYKCASNLIYHMLDHHNIPRKVRIRDISIFDLSKGMLQKVAISMPYKTILSTYGCNSKTYEEARDRLNVKLRKEMSDAEIDNYNFEQARIVNLTTKTLIKVRIPKKVRRHPEGSPIINYNCSHLI